VKRTLLTLVVAIGMTAAAGAASAQSLPVDAGYGTAGCGLGSIVFGAKPGIIQIFAATTNGTFDSQTFGITTGTSNCVDAPSSAGATASFIQTNREVLAKDISRGTGETITTLSTLAGCKNPDAVGKTLQSKYRDIFPNAEVTNVEVSGRVVSILRKDTELSCTKLQTTEKVASKPAKTKPAMAQK
jgi:hypothetical protein